MSRFLKVLIFLFFASSASISAVGIGAIVYNNRSVDFPERTELARSLEASIVWLVDNEEAMLSFDNPVLWYFMQRAAEKTGDERLQSLLEAYNQKYSVYNNEGPRNLWYAMFKPGSRAGALPFETIINLNYYSQHFAYAIYCDDELGQLEAIKAQNDASFCGPKHVIRPTCTTHQLMGIRFLQRANCGDESELASTVEALNAMIIKELTYDPRVIDVYIQRVMMLVDSGNSQLVKNIWLRQILDNQNPDGGWGNFQSLFALSQSEPLHIGYGYGASETGNPRAGRTFFKLLGVGQPRSTFHATVQGTMLLALLLDELEID